MATQQITTTIVVQFKGGGLDDAGRIQAELDSTREGNLNGGKTTFGPGDSVHILVYKSTGIVVSLPTTSVDTIQGTAVTKEGEGTLEVEETLRFVNQRDATARFPIQSLDSFKWVGNSLGLLTQIDDITLRASTEGLSIAKVVYTAAFEIYRLSGVPVPLNAEDEFDVIIFIEGQEA